MLTVSLTCIDPDLEDSSNRECIRERVCGWSELSHWTSACPLKFRFSCALFARSLQGQSAQRKKLLAGIEAANRQMKRWRSQLYRERLYLLCTKILSRVQLSESHRKKLCKLNTVDSILSSTFYIKLSC